MERDLFSFIYLFPGPVDIRQNFFMIKIVRHWYRLPRGAAEAPFLEVFNSRLEGALSKLISEWCPCLWQEGWNEMTFKLAFLIKTFYGYVILHECSSWLFHYENQQSISRNTQSKKRCLIFNLMGFLLATNIQPRSLEQSSSISRMDFYFI